MDPPPGWLNQTRALTRGDGVGRVGRDMGLGRWSGCGGKIGMCTSGKYGDGGGSKTLRWMGDILTGTRGSTRWETRGQTQRGLTTTTNSETHSCTK